MLDERGSAEFEMQLADREDALNTPTRLDITPTLAWNRRIGVACAQAGVPLFCTWCCVVS